MMFGWLTRNWFLLGLVGVTGLAFLIPELGARGGPLRPEITTKAGVAVIFFIQGLVIAPAALRAGALRWRLHLAIQLFVFVGFPIAVILLDVAAGQLLPLELRMGFLFLAILPTTISTCVVFTAAAGGNTTGAIFNSALANVAGVLLTPLWAALLLSARGHGPAFGSMVGEVALLLLAPLALGQAIRPLVRRRVGEPSARVLGVITNSIILFIIFTAFSGSVGSGTFAETGLLTSLSVAVVGGGLFVTATGVAHLAGGRLRFTREDRVALLFCGPQKTLASGAPMAQILFAGHPGLGLILLPVIIYHAVQLVGGATLAQRLGRIDRADGGV